MIIKIWFEKLKAVRTAWLLKTPFWMACRAKFDRPLRVWGVFAKFFSLGYPRKLFDY